MEQLKQVKFIAFFAVFVMLQNSALAESSVDRSSNSSDRWALAGFTEADIPSNKLANYRRLERVRIEFASDELLAQLRAKFPDIEFLTADTQSEQQPDAIFLSCGSPAALTQASQAIWIHSYSAGVEACIDHPVFAAQNVKATLTNSRGTAASVIAEHAIAMMMSFARGLHRFRDAQLQARWSRDMLREGGVTTTVGGKTMLVLGLGSIGKDVARRANALGMRVLATRNRSRSGPDYVDYVGLADETLKLASQADVVVNALPLTESTKGLLDETFFQAMKPTAMLVSVGRGGTTNTDALLDALREKQIAGAALDVTDPEPLPADHPRWRETNVIITPHLAGSGGEAREKTFALAVENLRRYQAGEPLLNMVDPELGY